MTIDDTESVNALKRAFRSTFGRAPRPEDRVFNGLQTGRGGKHIGMTTAALYGRVQAIMAKAKDAGLVRRNLHVCTHTLRHTCASLLVEGGAQHHPEELS